MPHDFSHTTLPSQYDRRQDSDWGQRIANQFGDEALGELAEALKTRAGEITAGIIREANRRRARSKEQ